MSQRDTSSLLFAVRGLAILQVALIHTIGVTSNDALRAIYGDSVPWLGRVAEFIHFYNMPVMLVGSGLAAGLFGSRPSSWGSFFTKRVNRFLVPLMIWAPLFYVLQAARHGGLKHVAWAEAAQAVVLPFSIFWFFHALLYAMVIQKIWQSLRLKPVFSLLASLALYVGGLTVHQRFAGGIADQTYFICYWNLFFSLGTVLVQWPKTLTGMAAGHKLCVTTLALGVLLSAEVYHTQVTEPLLAHLLVPFVALAAWTLQFQLVSVLAASGRLFDAVAYAGSTSLCIFLFHIHFLGVSRALTQRLFPHLVAWNVAIGTAFAVLAPILVFKLLRNQKWFAQSIGGLPHAVVRSDLGDVVRPVFAVSRGPLVDNLPPGGAVSAVR